MPAKKQLRPVLKKQTSRSVSQKKHAPFWPFGVLTFLTILFIDQFTKRAILSSYAIGESHEIFSWLSFTYVQNTGALWSVAQGMNGAFIWLSIVAFGLLIYFSQEFTSIPAKIAYALVLAGLWGNLLDRLAHGYVIDFIDLGWWPVFNVADSAIVVAVIVLVIEQLRKK